MIKRFLLFALLLFSAALTTKAAEEPPITTISKYGESAARYIIGDENQLMMIINVWGRVVKPGQYVVPTDTDLITLISVAGGPADKSRLDNVKLVRGASSGSEVIDVNIRKYLKTGDRNLIPTLKPEDTIIVSGSVWYLFSTVVQVVAQLAIVANVYYLAHLSTRR
ncbi:MAG: SLBB domain-containing protein [bacterium]|nr:SLBB domain-containing protein [bacterium]